MKFILAIITGLFVIAHADNVSFTLNRSLESINFRLDCGSVLFSACTMHEINFI